PIFEIREKFGNTTNLLITSREMGAALAESLGQDQVVLMRGHGSTAVGPSLKMAVYGAVYTEVNAQLLSSAAPLGPVEYLTIEEANATMETQQSQIDRPWNLWKAAANAAQVPQ